MRSKHLNTTIDAKYIFALTGLSFHTCCILSKIITDFMKEGDALPGWIYLDHEIFNVWPEDVVFSALDELGDAGIMFIAPPEDMVDDEGNVVIAEGADEDEELYERSILIFDPEFIEDVCPFIGVCPCCNPDKKSFDIIYN